MAEVVLRDVLHTDGKYWDRCFIPLGSGKSLCVERAGPENDQHSGYAVYFNNSYVSVDNGIAEDISRTDYIDLDELFAQAIVDHYVQLYGLSEDEEIKSGL